jgi:GntR family transcriptional regulator
MSDRIRRKLSTRPLYLQLHDALAERVVSGEWKPGPIPNEGELAREYGVSTGTMRKALDLLEAEHLVTRRQGRGTFVNDQTAGNLVSRFVNVRTSDGRRVMGKFAGAKIAKAPANESERERLALGEDDLVHRIHRLRVDGNRTFLVEDVSLPTSLFPTVPDSIPDIVALAQQNGVVLGKAEERITIKMATPEVSRLLAISDNSAVLVLDRIVYCLDGRPAEWRVGFCNLANAYSYVAEIG